MKNIYKILMLICLSSFCSLNLLSDDLTSLDTTEYNQKKFKTMSEMKENLEDRLNSTINVKYNCAELFKKFKSLPDYEKRHSDLIYNEVFTLYKDNYDLGEKPKFLGIRYIELQKQNNKCSVELDNIKLNSDIEQEKIKLLPDLIVTQQLFDIYFDDLIKNINVKNEVYLDYVAIYNIHKNFKDDLEITNFLKNNLNDEKGFTQDKKNILKALVDENYKVILEKEKEKTLEEHKKITKNKNVLKNLEIDIDKENKSKLISSYLVYPFSY